MFSRMRIHTGKQTKGILNPWLIKSNKQISVACRCDRCGKELVVYDSTMDGLTPLNVEKSSYETLAIKGTDVFKITLYDNYWEEDYMTNRFVECFIHATDANGKKRVLFEG